MIVSWIAREGVRDNVSLALDVFEVDVELREDLPPPCQSVGSGCLRIRAFYQF